MLHGASAFNQDISGWAVDSVMDMEYMFRHAEAFDQDLGWCVDNDVGFDPDGQGYTFQGAFYNTPCEATSCGVKQRQFETEDGSCGTTPAPTISPLAADDSTIRTAVTAWLADPTAAETTYGHISTWETGGVTDMSYLFSTGSNSGVEFFNEDIGAWDTSGVTSMREMFSGASAFDQDLGWCVDDDVYLGSTFYNTPCASTSCGVNNRAALRCDGAMSDRTIRQAVALWLSDRAAAEATYGHIST